MQLLEAIVDANHRALAGDEHAGLHPADFTSSLPLAALTCIDPRLNPLFPAVLALPKEQFIWLRNAGNIITGPMSSTMRSLALACAVKGAKEIAIIGHTDCQVRKTSISQLTEAFHTLGVERSALPENLTEFFGLFASEQQNVIKAVDYARQCPLFGGHVPIHGLIVDVNTGRLEWVVNGYQTLTTAVSPKIELARLGNQSLEPQKSFAAFTMGEMKFPETKIGEVASVAGDYLAKQTSESEARAAKPGQPPPLPKIPPPKAREIHIPGDKKIIIVR